MAIEERNRDQDQITVSSAGASFSDVCFVLFVFQCSFFGTCETGRGAFRMGLVRRVKKKEMSGLGFARTHDG